MTLRSPRLFNTACIAILACAPFTASAADTITADPKGDEREVQTGERGAGKTADRSAVDQMIAGWPERPRLGAAMMIAKYGPPQEASDEVLTWRDQGAYKSICVTREEHAHDFPKPHTDFLEHTIAYKVPADRAEELTKFDGSLTFDRTRGEMSARCDLEGHNILTLNLANDVATGKLDADGARKKFGEIVAKDALGEKPPYTAELQFEPAKEATTFRDKPTMPGSSKRADQDAEMKAGKDGMSDAEILGTLIAVNDNEIIAAMVAQQKKVDPQVLEYATMLHQEHGKNLEQTMKLAKKIDVTPIETTAVDAKRTKAAGELAALVPLDGDEFAAGYIAMMVKGHQEVLEAIDGTLLPAAKKDDLKEHLTKTRTHIANHLEQAQAIQTSMKR